MSVDARTNTIIIRDIASNVEEAKQIVKQFDTPVKQVMIEARIVDATDRFIRDLGIQWDQFQIQQRSGTGVTFTDFGGTPSSVDPATPGTDLLLKAQRLRADRNYPGRKTGTFRKRRHRQNYFSTQGYRHERKDSYNRQRNIILPSGHREHSSERDRSKAFLKCYPNYQLQQLRYATRGTRGQEKGRRWNEWQKLGNYSTCKKW
ncbi:MAG: hypothetical protein JRI79_01565 [Deltaproteobacteria bacterium]|nr:hypothetical protein [Deltaproteobacteria bacterium]